MTTMTRQLQPAIGLNGLNALNHAAKITNAYSAANMTKGGHQSSEEKKVSITDKIPLVGHWANRILHKYSAFKPLAKTVNGYDDANRKYAQKEFSLALANGPATREGRQSLAYHIWGYLCDTGHDLLDLGSNIASLYSFYIDISQALAVALAPVTEGATLLALPELEANKVASEVLSTGLALSAAEAGAAFLNYRAVQSQDGVGTVAEILSGYQENTTERLFAYVSWALKEFKFLSPKRQLKTIKNAGSFMSRASQWSVRTTKLLGDKTSKDLPGVAKAASWAKQIYKMYGYIKKAKEVGKSLWALIKDPAKMLWKTAKFGLDVGKRAVKGAIQMGVHAGKWLGQKAHEAGQGITHAAHNSAKWIGGKAHAAGQWIGQKAHDFGQGMLQNREWIGDVLHQSSDIFGALSAVTGVTAAGLALLGIGLPIVLPFAAGIGTASLAFAAAAAAAHAWYSTSLAVGTLDGSVSASAANAEAKGAAVDTALVMFSGGTNKIGELRDTALGLAKGEENVASKGSAIQKTLGAFGKLKSAFQRLQALPLQKIVKDKALAKRLQFLTKVSKVVDFVNAVVGLVTAPLSSAVNAVVNAGKFVFNKGKAAAKSAANWTGQKAQAVGQWGAQKAQQVGSFATGMASKASSAVGSAFGSLAHGFGIHFKALPEAGFENTGEEQAARKLEQTIATSPTLLPGRTAIHSSGTRHPARHGHSARHPSAGFLERKAQFHTIMDAARAAGDLHPDVAAAQWALESAWGKKVTGKNNYFGIKSTDGKGTLSKTHEVVHGKRVATQAHFRDYASLPEGIAAHSQFLQGPRYAKSGYGTAKTAEEAVAALVKGHYATDPNYAQALLPNIRRYGGEDSTPSAPAALQRKGSGDHPDVNPAALRDDLRKQSTGFVPDSNVRAKLGGHLGFDPGGARLHTGPAAASASRALNAEAFTIGNDVFFGDGRFDPHSPKGLGLIAHELTHVGQQTGTTGNKARFFTQEGGDAMEREAQQTAAHVLANVGSRQGLFVEDYVREYEGEGGLSQADQKRLDRISVLALDQAQKMLAARGVRGRVNANALDVQFEIDIGEISDGEAAQVWALAIVSSISAIDSAGAQVSPFTFQSPVGEVQRAKSNPANPSFGIAPLPASTPAAVPGVPTREFVLNGKTQLVTEEEYPHLVSEANRRLSIRLGLVESGAADGKKIQENFINDTHKGFSGIFGKASDWMGGVKPPTPAIWEWPKPPIASGREALQSRKLTEAAGQLTIANSKLAQARGQWHEYINGTISGADTGIEVATVVRDTSFSIAVGSAAIVAAPVIAGGLAAAGAGTALTAVGTTTAVTLGGGAMGAALRGGSEIGGEALADHGHVDWHHVGHEAWDGAKHGSVDAATSVIGMGVGRVGAKFIRPSLNTLGARAVRGAVTGSISGGVGGFLNAVVTPPERRKEDGPESWGEWAKRVGMSTALGAGSGALGSVGNEFLAGASPGTMRRMLAVGASNAVSGGGTAAAQEAMDAHREHRKFNRNVVYKGAVTSGVSSGLQAGASGAYRTRNADGTRRIVSMEKYNQRFDQAFNHVALGRQLMSKPTALLPNTSTPERTSATVESLVGRPEVPSNEQMHDAHEEPASPLKQVRELTDEQLEKAMALKDDPGSFAGKRMLQFTKTKTYLVRVQSKTGLEGVGRYGINLFASLEEARYNANRLSKLDQSAIRDMLALKTDWNDIKGVQVFEVPENSPYLTGEIAPQTEGTTHIDYQGGETQVLVPVENLRPVSELLPIENVSLSLDIIPNSRYAEWFNDYHYSSAVLEAMRDNMVTPRTVEDAIHNGSVEIGDLPGSIEYYSAGNHLLVTVDSTSKKILSVRVK